MHKIEIIILNNSKYNWSCSHNRDDSLCPEACSEACPEACSEA